MELPGDDHLPFVGDQDAILDEIEHFLTASARRTESDRVLATVLAVEFTNAAIAPLASATGSGRRCAPTSTP